MGTSGVLVVAKNDAAHRELARQFQDHSIERRYCALVLGVPGRDDGRVDLPVGRHMRDRKRMRVRARVAREARSVWRVRRRFRASDCSMLEVRPETGRTHQIRVHLAAVGMPLIGDPVYGRRRVARVISTLGRPALHAQQLGFRHPGSGELLRFDAPLPADLADALSPTALYGSQLLLAALRALALLLKPGPLSIDESAVLLGTLSVVQQGLGAQPGSLLLLQRL